MRRTFSMDARLVTWGQGRLLTGQPPKDPGQRINSRSSPSQPHPALPQKAIVFVFSGPAYPSGNQVWQQ